MCHCKFVIATTQNFQFQCLLIFQNPRCCFPIATDGNSVILHKQFFSCELLICYFENVLFHFLLPFIRKTVWPTSIGFCHQSACLTMFFLVASIKESCRYTVLWTNSYVKEAIKSRSALSRKWTIWGTFPSQITRSSFVICCPHYSGTSHKQRSFSLLLLLLIEMFYFSKNNTRSYIKPTICALDYIGYSISASENHKTRWKIHVTILWLFFFSLKIAGFSASYRPFSQWLRYVLTLSLECWKPFFINWNELYLLYSAG